MAPEQNLNENLPEITFPGRRLVALLTLQIQQKAKLRYLCLEW